MQAQPYTWGKEHYAGPDMERSNAKSFQTGKTVKDVLAVENMPCTCGSKILEGFVPPFTATAVRKLQEAGAIVTVAAPEAVLIRPDGHVAWVGDRTQVGLADALTTWFGAPTQV